jgi:pyrroline-5-carboxylate reductase
VRRAERAKELEERYGVRAVPAAEAAGADVLLVTVKPQDIEGLVSELAPYVQRSSLVVSLAAGIPTAYYGHRLAPGVPVVRVMTNTPVLVDEAMSAISAGAYAEERHLALTEQLLRPVGKVVRVPEAQQDAVTARRQRPGVLLLPGRGDDRCRHPAHPRAIAATCWCRPRSARR